MNVRMPDGKILRGVPEGTSKADIMARYSRRTGTVTKEDKKIIGVPKLGEDLKITGEPAYTDVLSGLIPAAGAAKGAQLAYKGGRKLLSRIGKKEAKEFAKKAAIDLGIEEALRHATAIPGVGAFVRPAYGLLSRRRFK